MRKMREELGWSLRKRRDVPALIRDFLKHRLARQRTPVRRLLGRLVNVRPTAEEVKKTQVAQL